VTSATNLYMYKISQWQETRN